MRLQIESLFQEYIKLQQEFGDPTLSPIYGAIFKTFQFGQAQGGSEISTAGILRVFRGLKFSPNAEIGRNGTF